MSIILINSFDIKHNDLFERSEKVYYKLVSLGYLDEYFLSYEERFKQHPKSKYIVVYRHNLGSTRNIVGRRVVRFKNTLDIKKVYDDIH